jgi:hypothetical protein
MPPKRTLARKRQTKINFSPAAKPTPQTDTRKHTRAVSLSSDSDDAIKSRPTKRRKLGKDKSRRDVSSRSTSDIEVSSARSSSDESDAEVVVVNKRKAPQSAATAEESDDEVLPAARTSKSRARRTQVQRSGKEPEVSGRRRAALATSDDEEQAPRRRKLLTRRHRADESSEVDEDETPPKHSQRRGGRQPSTPEQARFKKSRHKVDAEPSPPAQGLEEAEEEEGEGGDSVDEDDELKEELAFLRSSPLPDRGRLRSTHEKPKSEREKALEALKKRRGGTTEPSSSATPSRKKPLVIDSDSESELEVIAEEEEDDVNAEEEMAEEEVEDDDEGDEPNAFSIFQENGEDEDFIDDDSALIGVPAEHTSIPLEFTSLSRAKPRELFKYAIEWMVQKKINPAFAADDEIYTLAFKKLNDEVSGLASSKFHSSVWTPDFSRAIKARPNLEVHEVGHHLREVLEPHCEACNRKNHVATWEASLTGTPYNERTLEPLADDTDSDSESDSDSSISSRASSADLNGEKAAYNANGECLPPVSKFWTLGSTCRANAQVAHTLYHWRYHLNSLVVDYLVQEGKCTPEKLAKRDKWSVKKRAKYANKIVDKMEKEGEIRQLHRAYKDQVNFALEAKNEYAEGWGRRKG